MLNMKVTVTSINMPVGTVTLKWDDGREFTYTLPVDFTAGNRPFTREEFLDWLVAESYEFKEELAAREQLAPAMEAAANSFGLFEEIDLTSRGESYRLAREAAGAPQRGPRPE